MHSCFAQGHFNGTLNLGQLVTAVATPCIHNVETGGERKEKKDNMETAESVRNRQR